MTTATISVPARQGVGSAALLRAIGFVSFFDRFSAVPMLSVIAVQQHVPLSQAAALLAAYSLAYALGQPLWGMLGDRIGRLATLRIALSGALLASAATVFVPSMSAVFVVRIVCGLFVGSLLPTILTMTGDTVPAGVERGRAVSALQTATALGTTVATVSAGAIAALTSWRVVPALVAIAAATLLACSLRIAAPVATAGAQSSRRIRSAWGRWPLVLYGIALLEGALLLGVFSYIAPAIEDAGVPVAAAGLLIVGYGVTIIACAQLNRWLLRVWPRSRIMLFGALALAAAYALAATGAIVALAVAAALVGASNALLHTALQSWATEVAPEVRGTTVSFFVCSLFLGSSIATFLIAPVTDSYHAVFVVSMIGALLLGAVSVTAYRRWQERSSR